MALMGMPKYAGGGGEITASSETYALTAGASTWTAIPTTDITVDGYMC